MNIRSKILAGVGGLVLMLLLIAGVGLYGTSHIAYEIGELAHWTDVDMVMNEGVTQKILATENAATAFRGRPSKENYSHFQAQLSEAVAGLQEWREMLTAHPQLAATADQVGRALDEYSQAMSAYHKLTEDKEHAKDSGDQLVSELLAMLLKTMEDEIDPAKERAEQAADIDEMVHWGAIDMVMNEAVIANALKLQTALHEYFYARDEHSYAALQKQQQALAAGVAEWREVLNGAGAIETVGRNVAGYLPKFTGVFDIIRKDDEKAVKLSQQLATTAAQVYAVLEHGMETIIDPAKVAAMEDAEASKERVTLAVTVVSLASILFALVAGVWFAGQIANPLKRTAEMLEDIARGRVGKRLGLGDRKDEVGQMARSMDAFADNLEAEVIPALQALAQGDLTVKITPYDGQDQIRTALQKLCADLNGLVVEISSAGKQIAMGSVHVSDSSQSLSQGATEQASSLEEITSSITEISSQTERNNNNAKTGNELASKVKKAAEAGNTQMQNLVGAMGEINAAAQDISKIIKVIDEIAFQTNLLALNAAVEAARAGQHGKGFAVVAEEVRNLAARSAKAASETSGLIVNSVEKAGNGSTIAEDTAKDLAQIVEGIGQISELVAEIAASSNEQSVGVQQIAEGLHQIDQVTQNNTASAEEGAAAAEELSGQAATLRQMLERFKLSNDVAAGQFSQSVSATQNVPQSTVQNIGWVAAETASVSHGKIALDDGEFGRY